MDVRYARAATTAIIWIVRDGEKSNSGLQSPSFFDLLVEIMDDWDVQSSRTGLDPVFTQLVAVTRMNRLYSVTEIIQDTRKGLERPAFAAKRFPNLAIVFEWSE